MLKKYRDHHNSLLSPKEQHEEKSYQLIRNYLKLQCLLFLGIVLNHIVPYAIMQQSKPEQNTAVFWWALLWLPASTLLLALFLVPYRKPLIGMLTPESAKNTVITYHREVYEDEFE